MNHTVHNKLVSFIWSIADDCLRDVYVRGKYRDVILPMVVLRRLDALLEPTKQHVLEEVEFQKSTMKFTEWDDKGMTAASGYVFYNTSDWTLQSLYGSATNSQQILLGNFEDYLNGFSANVQEIISKFNLRAQIKHMANKDVLLDVLEKFTSPDINLTPFDKLDSAGKKLPALTNLGMGYVFEELIRKFNEENNEEAGEHYTPREVIDLMTHMVFDPIKDQIPSVITIYDPACGTGGMLTESENFITDPEGEIKATNTSVYMFGKEVNDETYAICKSDMMIKGKDPEHIKVGSTLSTDEFAGTKFDFMLSNPPYGKSWASEQKYIKDGKEIIDNRFKIKLKNYWGEEEYVDAVPRSSDGQLLFLMEMVDKMKPLTDRNKIGSRIASVHNGSSLFTGDAGGGESNIRRHIIENDLLDVIIQLPNNIFYNTGITTYIWILTNNKPSQRKGKVQLIDASEMYQKLRKNLGNKNCELSKDHISEILNCYLKLSEQEKEGAQKLASKVFDNADFGYYKVNIERPKRLKAQFTEEKIEVLKWDKTQPEFSKYLFEQYGTEVYTGLEKYKKEIADYIDKEELNINTKQQTAFLKKETWLKQKELHQTAAKLMEVLGTEVYTNFNLFTSKVDEVLKKNKTKLSAAEKKQILDVVSWYDEEADKVIKKTEKLNSQKLADLLDYLGCDEKDLSHYGYFSTDKKGEYILYETESDLRDSESIPLKDNIQEYFLKEVKPYVEESWIALDSVKIGYELSFNKYFYKPAPLRSLEEVTKEILALEKEGDGLLAEILNF
ncbi:SAM-dependent DNA methyltransferase [Elizabethkingia anophelis]|nr:SAM-dependent DNA methyltransferase [Elizabethkingia anophelis]MCT3694723.1 SAM-dependent DNA methyltransferase [Elizabethkingia anophelis]MCT3858049.1 SAM-dependent DNA methyltransferase [Elizabethkingia anophelis]MCT3911533.1 SAM-dependent DNA methyltransferase [Elizabethkingia anophelis]MCT4311112.1 SAM-dependent DNA methyltransferase [Elizabethkingia anophelis]